MKGKLNRPRTINTGLGEIALQALSIPSALVTEAYEGLSGKGDGEFNFKDAMPKQGGILGNTGTQKSMSSITHPNANFGKQFVVDVATDPLTYAGGLGVIKKFGTKGLKTIGNKVKNMKRAVTQKSFAGGSPLFRNKTENDSIASVKAWKAHKAGYLKKPGGQKEYDMEKGEFFYSPQHKKLRLIPTDDGEVQDRSGIEKWQLAPDRMSSGKGKSNRIDNRIERIEKRFRKQIAKGKKGTDMDIELHERRIKDLRDKK